MTDITEHPTREGKVYCAVVLMSIPGVLLVGRLMLRKPRRLSLTRALGMAIEQRQPAAGETVIHSDQGTQFTSWAFTRRAIDSGLYRQ